MLSINPKADGTLPPVTKQRLAEIGSWMKINGEAIYATRPAVTFGYNNGTNQIRFTTNKDNTIIYIFSSTCPWQQCCIKCHFVQFGKSGQCENIKNYFAWKW